MKECIRINYPCPYKLIRGIEAKCNIRGPHYFCEDEEEYMADVLEAEVKLKKRGLKEISRIEKMIKELNDYLEIVPSAEVSDRVNDAVKELRKARLGLMERYKVDVEDLLNRKENDDS